MSDDIKRDLLGQKLEIGDWVVLNRGAYSRLVVGKIVKMTAQNVRVEFLNSTETKTLQSDRVVKLDEEAVIAYKLKGKQQ